MKLKITYIHISLISLFLFGCKGTPSSEESKLKETATVTPLTIAQRTIISIPHAEKTNEGHHCYYEARNANPEAFDKQLFTVGVSLNEKPLPSHAIANSTFVLAFFKSLYALMPSVVATAGFCATAVTPDPTDVFGGFAVQGIGCAAGATGGTLLFKSIKNDLKISSHFDKLISERTPEDIIDDLVASIQHSERSYTESGEGPSCPQMLTYEMARYGKTSEAEYDGFRKTMGTKKMMDKCPSRKYQITEPIKVFSGNSAGSKLLGVLSSPSVVELAVDYKYAGMGRAYFKLAKKYSGESFEEETAWINPDFGLSCIEQ